MKKLKIILLVLVAAACVAQFVRPERVNPASDPSHAISADTTVPPHVQSIFARACNDCHSNLTRWPWYSNITPVNYLVESDIRKGRRHVNFSEWSTMKPVKRQQVCEDLLDEVTHHGMPPASYLFMHGDAKLSETDIQAVAEWARSRKIEKE